MGCGAFPQVGGWGACASWCPCGRLKLTPPGVAVAVAGGGGLTGLSRPESGGAARAPLRRYIAAHGRSEPLSGVLHVARGGCYGDALIAELGLTVNAVEGQATGGELARPDHRTPPVSEGLPGVHRGDLTP